VFSQAGEDFFPTAISSLAQEFLQGKVDHVAVMKLLGCNVIAERKPKSVQKIDFLGSEMRGMGSKIKNVLLLIGRMDFKRQPRLRLRQSLPGQTCYASLLGQGSSGRESQNHG
jgi:hypothetical protein